MYKLENALAAIVVAAVPYNKYGSLDFVEIVASEDPDTAIIKMKIKIGLENIGEMGLLDVVYGDTTGERILQILKDEEQRFLSDFLFEYEGFQEVLAKVRAMGFQHYLPSLEITFSKYAIEAVNERERLGLDD